MVPRRVALVIAASKALVAAVVGLGVFVALPARWWPVDVGAIAVVLVETAGAAGLCVRAPWALRVARAGSCFVLSLGLLTVTGLALGASWLSGVYGAVGLGGAVVLTLVLVLALPYLVAIPVAQLLGLRVGGDREPTASGKL